MLALGTAALHLLAWAAAFNDPATDSPRFGKPLNNLTVSLGREAVFACVVDNLGPYKVAWLRVDTQTILTISSHVVTKNHRIAVTHSGHRTWSLHIRDTRQADRGWYMCQVNTDPMSSNTAFLEIVVPPDILDYPTSTDMMVREGSNVTLRCAATGSPEPTVTWRREAGGSIILSNWQEVASIEGPELEITRVNRLHMGAYLCIASNGVPPTVSKRIVLIVHFPPMLRIENQLVGAYEGQALTMECHSEAYPRPITYWTSPTNETVNNSSVDLERYTNDHYRLETLTLGYETSMKLTIRSVRTRDLGPYRCIATNSLGETAGKIQIYRIAKPASALKPGSRRDSGKFWSKDRGSEKAAVGSAAVAADTEAGSPEDEARNETESEAENGCLTSRLVGSAAAAYFCAIACSMIV